MVITEEKKLTDDIEINVGMMDKEVIQALEWALITSSWTANVAGKEQNMFRAILDLIRRQKAEIKRLTAEINQRREMMSRMDCNYATELQKNSELQKQVDGLKQEKLDAVCDLNMRIIELDNELKQVAKDTAKEILGDLRNAFIEQTSYGCDANQHIGYYDYEIKIGLAIEQIDEYAKEKYGIEYDVEV